MKTLQNFTKSSLPVLGAIFGGVALDHVTRQILDQVTGIDISLVPASLSASFGAVLVYKKIQSELAENLPRNNGPV